MSSKDWCTSRAVTSALSGDFKVSSLLSRILLVLAGRLLKRRLDGTAVDKHIRPRMGGLFNGMIMGEVSRMYLEQSCLHTTCLQLDLISYL